MRRPIVGIYAALIVVVVGLVTLAAQAQSVRLAVFVVEFPGMTPYPDTMERARVLADDGQRYFTEVSYGKYTLQADVFGIYTVPLDGTATMVDIRREAFAAAEAAGVDLSVYSKWAFIHPATINARGEWGDFSGVYLGMVGNAALVPTQHYFFHGLGHHLFGLNHARGTQCRTDATGTVICEAFAPYGDNLDVMGAGDTNHFNALTKARLGWLTITPVTGSGDYVIEPLETVSGGIQALSFNIGRKNRQQTLVLQYRQPIGFDVYTGFANPANVFNGVEFHMDLNGSEQMEMNAYTPNQPYEQNYNPTLTVGQTYCNGEAHISATVVSVSSAGAVMRMNTKARC